jgi:hypothetical protein
VLETKARTRARRRGGAGRVWKLHLGRLECENGQSWAGITANGPRPNWPKQITLLGSPLAQVTASSAACRSRPRRRLSPPPPLSLSGKWQPASAPVVLLRLSAACRPGLVRRSPTWAPGGLRRSPARSLVASAGLHVCRLRLAPKPQGASVNSHPQRPNPNPAIRSSNPSTP